MIPINSPLKDFFHLGAEYPLYFYLMKCTILLLLLILAVSGLYNLASNLVSNNCEIYPGICKIDFITQFLFVNKSDEPDLLRVQSILDFIAITLLILFHLVTGYKLKKLYQAINKNKILPSDYTVRLENIPSNMDDNKVLEWIKSFEKKNQLLEVAAISRPYNILNYVQSVQKKIDLKKLYLEKNENDPALRKQLDQIENSLQNQEATLLKTATVFVTFKSTQRNNIHY